jgi:hypothetical protein
MNFTASSVYISVIGLEAVLLVMTFMIPPSTTSCPILIVAAPPLAL